MENIPNVKMSSKIALTVAEELKKFSEKISEGNPRIWYLVRSQFKEYGSKVDIHLKKKGGFVGEEETFAQVRVKVRSMEDVGALQKLLVTLKEVCLENLTKD